MLIICSANDGMIIGKQIGLTNAFDCTCPEYYRRIIKAFQNPIWAEQARERLKQIKMLTKVATV